MRIIGSLRRSLLTVVLAGIVQAASGQGIEIWVPAPEMPTARSGIVAAEIDGYVYVIGGRDGRDRPLDVVERFDPVSGEWIRRSPMPTPRYGASSAVFQGKMYVMGGRGPRVFGGGDRHVLDVVEVYDPGSDSWEALEPLRNEREGHVAFVLRDTIYVVGGSDRSQTILSSIEYLAPLHDDAWRTDVTLQMDFARAALAVAVVGTRAYAVGGFTPVPVNLVEEFHGSRRHVVLPPGHFRARGAHAAVAVGDTIFVAGGRGPRTGVGPPQEPVLDDVDAYVVSTGEWRSSASLLTARESFGAAAVDRRVYVIGGRDEDGDVLASVEVMEIAPSTSSDRPETTDEIGLFQSAPNPFSERTLIRFDVASPSSGAVLLQVYDATGRLVRTLMNGIVAAGRHEVEWNGYDDSGAAVASGIYLCRLTQGSNLATRKLVLVR